VGVFRDCRFLSTPIISGMGNRKATKLRTSNFVRTFVGSIGTKAHISAKVASRGRTQGLSKFFLALISSYVGPRAHRAVTFAVAQLSC